MKICCITVLLKEVPLQWREGGTNKERETFSVTFCAWFKELRGLKTQDFRVVVLEPSYPSGLILRSGLHDSTRNNRSHESVAEEILCQCEVRVVNKAKVVGGEFRLGEPLVSFEAKFGEEGANIIQQAEEQQQIK